MIPGNAEISADQHDAVLQRTRADRWETRAQVEIRQNTSTAMAGGRSVRRPRQSGGSVLTDGHLGRPGIPALPCPLGGATAVQKGGAPDLVLLRDTGWRSNQRHCAYATLRRRCSRRRGAMLRVRRRHDLAQVCQERTSLLSLLHKHAAAVHRVHLAPGEAQFA